MQEVEKMSLADLCHDLIRAKERESQATEERVAIEQIITRKTGLPDEGQKTYDAGEFKLTIGQKINRKLDAKKWLTIQDAIPEHLRPVRVEEVFKLEDQGVRWLRENEPGYFKILAQAMEEKPAKPSVKVEEA